MNIPQINNSQYSYTNAVVPAFMHGTHVCENKYSKKERAIVAATSAIGVMTSLACLAKHNKYSLNPRKMFNLKNIKNSYLAKVQFEAEEVCSMGVGTCLGGLTGGYIIDKDKDNRKAKRREAVMQIGNISIPIYTVKKADQLSKKLKFSTPAQACMDIAAIFVGVFVANVLMNKLGDILFHNKDNKRAVKTTDFSAHLDDFIVASGYIANGSKVVHTIGRAVPVALMIPGYEIGNKKSHSH